MQLARPSTVTFQGHDVLNMRSNRIVMQSGHNLTRARNSTIVANIYLEKLHH